MTADSTDRGSDLSSPGWTRKLPAAVGVATLTGIVQLPIFDRWFSVMDEAHMLLFADLVTQGQRLYSDMTIYPLPGAFYLLALAFEVFGPSILVARWLVVIEFSLLVAMVHWLVGRITSARWAWACVFALWLYRVWAFPHWQMFNYSSTALVVLLASLSTLIAYFASDRPRTLAAAGLLFGLGVLCKQDYGAAAMIAALVAIVTHSKAVPGHRLARQLGLFGVPAATVGALAGLHFWSQGQLGFVVQMTVLKHFVGLSTYEYQAFPAFWPVFSQDPALRDLKGLYNFFPPIVSMIEGPRAFSGAWFQHTALYDAATKAFVYGPIALVAWACGSCWRARAQLRDPLARSSHLARLTLTAFATSLVALAHWYRPQDYVHLAVLYWPLVAVAVVELRMALRGRRRLRWVVAAGLLLPLATATAYTASLAIRFRGRNSEPIRSERAGVRAEPGQVRMLAELVSYIQQHSRPDEPVAVLPYFSLAHFLANRHGPHGASYIVWPFPEYADRDQRIVDAMEATRTDLVIYNFTQFPNFPPVPEYAPVLYDYLVDHFATDRTFSDAALGFKLSALLRRTEAPGGRPLIAPERASLRVLGPGGSARTIEGSARDRYLAAMRWPFRDVIALRPTAAGQTVLSTSLDVAPGMHLQTAIGTHPDYWFRYPPNWVRFTISARSGDERSELFSRTLDPHQVLEDRGWFDVDLALDAYAGRTIDLEFATSTAAPGETSLRVAGFGVPTILVRSE